jgi:uncharacterized membrane protein YfcA
LLILAAAAAAAGFIQSVLGFGFGILVIAFAGPVLGAAEVSILAALAAFGLNGFVVSRLWVHLRRQHMLPIITAIAIGVPFGVTLLAGAPGGLFDALVALLIVVVVLQQHLPVLARYPWHPLFLGIPMGLFGGLLSGAFGTGGPPLVAQLFSQGWTRERTVASVQLLLLVAAAFRLLELWRRDIIGGDWWWPASLCLLACLGGSQLGLRVLHRIPERLFRRLVSIGLCLIAAWFLIRSIST